MLTEWSYRLSHLSQASDGLVGAIESDHIDL